MKRHTHTCTNCEKQVSATGHCGCKLPLAKSKKPTPPPTSIDITLNDAKVPLSMRCFDESCMSGPIWEKHMTAYIQVSELLEEAAYKAIKILIKAKLGRAL